MVNGDILIHLFIARKIKQNKDILNDIKMGYEVEVILTKQVSFQVDVKYGINGE